MKKYLIVSSFSLARSFILLAGMGSCYYNKEELLYPGSLICNSSEVKYSTTILPLVSASCYSCHAGAFPTGGIRLDSYADIRRVALDGKLYGTITHNGSFPPMPKDAPKLSECKIGYIKTWIDSGAPNN